ncbi:MAG: tyrosine-type recombinase/integrase [Phycisphaeraceae bacterium]|nr:tyrosine-type recombinase/integrase [Phycisphaeraceae bacterium]
MSHESNQHHIEQYLASITRRGYSTSTIKTYRRVLDDFLAWLDAQKSNLATIDRIDIGSFQIHLLQGPRGKPLSAGRRSLYIAVLRSFYKHCIEQALVPSAVLDWLDYPLQPKRLRQDILTLNEANALLDVALDKGGWQHIAVRLMLLSGLRAGEVAALEVRDISLFQREIVIRQAKGNKHRLVFIDPATKKHLASYLASRRSTSDQPNLLPTAPLLTDKGVPRNTDQIYGAVKRLADRAGITKQISPHSLRRTFATRLLDSGVKGMNLKVVAELLGHSSLRTTAKYAQIDEQSLARIYHTSHPARKEGLLA